MFWMQRLSLHSGLMKRMGLLLGIDFGRAVADGQLSPETLRGAFLRCAACVRPGACDRWLEDHSSGAEAAPPWCGNMGLMAELAQGPEPTGRTS